MKKTITLKLILLSLAFLSGSVFADKSSKCPGETGYYFTNSKSKNPEIGGFVSYSADVDESGGDVYIGRNAAVCGSSSVSGDVRIYGSAIIKDQATVSDRVKVFGNAVVGGDSILEDNVRVFGEAKVSGDAIISGKVKIYEKAIIGGDAEITGNTKVKGWSKIYSGKYSSGILDAPQFTDAELEAMKLNELKKQELINKTNSILSNKIMKELSLINMQHDKYPEENRIVKIKNKPCVLVFQHKSDGAWKTDYDYMVDFKRNLNVKINTNKGNETLTVEQDGTEKYLYFGFLGKPVGAYTYILMGQGEELSEEEKKPTPPTSEDIRHLNLLKDAFYEYSNVCKSN